MPSMHGKQLKNDSVILNKLSGTGSLILQSGATFQVPLTNILSATDVVNKQYVDSLSSGMTPHASVKTATTTNLNLAGATVSPFIGGYTVSTNDRILVKAQSVTASNGIYVYNGSTFDRAIDMDGQPSQEIKVGDYTFVVDGSFKGYGYVIVTSGTYSGVLEPVGVAPIVWSEFTGPVALTWGNGLIDSGSNVIDIDLASNSGLTFTSNQLTIDSNIAGSGLSWTLGVLSVNAANGLTINGDNVEISSSVAGTGLTFSSGVINLANTTVSAASYGSANSVGTFTVDAQGRLTTAATTLIDITSGQVNNFTASVQSLATQTYAGTGLTATGGTLSIANTTVSAGSYGSADTVGTFTVNAQGQLTTAGSSLISIPSGQVNNFTASSLTAVLQSANFVDSTTIDFTVTGGTSVTAVVANGSLTASHLNSTGGATAGYVLSVNSNGVFEWVDAASTGDITGVTAGNGLSGGGSSGFVTLDVNVDNGLSIVSDSVVLGGTLSAATTIETLGNAFNIQGTDNSIGIETAGTDSTLGLGDFNSGSGAYIALETSSGVGNAYIQGSVDSYIQLNDTLSGISFNTTSVELNDGVISIGTATLNSLIMASSSFILNLDGSAEIALYRAGDGVTVTDGSNDNLLVVTDVNGGKGIVYADDYTALFTDNSLVTKQYVDSVVVSAGLVAQNGLVETSPNVVELGGTLSHNTNLHLENFNLEITASTGDFKFSGSAGSVVELFSDNSFINIDTNVIELDSDGNTIITIDGASGVEISDGNSLGAFYSGDYEANFVNRSLVTKQYVDSAVSAGGLTATNGLTEISPNVVELGGTLTKNTTINGGNFSFDIVSLTSSSITAGAAGLFLSYDDTALVNVGGTVSIETTLNGNGLYISNSLMSVKDVNNKGLVYDGDYSSNFTTYSLVTKGYVDAAASSGTLAGIGLTKSGSTISIENTTVSAASYGSSDSVGAFTVNAQGQLTAASDSLISIPSGQVNNFTASVNTLIDTAIGAPVYSQRSLTPTVTSGNGSSTGITLTALPLDLANVAVYLNGQLQYLGDGTNTSVDCYFGTTSSSAKSISALTSGDTLYWNGTYIGFDLDAQDKIDIIYNA